jgi:hypothetical protein
MGTDILFKMAVLGVDGRAHWEQRVDNRALRFPSVDVQLGMIFNDHHMEAAGVAPTEQADDLEEAAARATATAKHTDPKEEAAARATATAKHTDPKEAGQSLPQPLRNATAERHASEELHEPDRLLREALTQASEASRRAEIAESRALRCEKLVQDAEMRALAAEKLVAELQAKLALSELQGARADLVQKVQAEIDLAAEVGAAAVGEGHLEKIVRKARAARARRYSGYSPGLDDAVLFNRNLSSTSAASSTCDVSEYGWVATPPTPCSRQSTSPQ